MSSLMPPSALPAFVPVPMARVQPGAQPLDTPTTVGRPQPALAAASVPTSLADEARPTRGTLEVPTDRQLRALDDATDISVGRAKNAKTFSTVAKSAKAAAESLVKQPPDLGLKAKDLKFLDWAKSAKSIAGAVASLPLTFYDAVSQYKLGRQAANTAQGAQAFEAGTSQLTNVLKQASPATQEQVDAARAELYSPAGAEGAQAWLKHREASKQSNLLGLGLGAASSVTSGTEAGFTTAWEVTKKAAGAEAAKSLKNAVPFVGIAGSVVGMATSAHACKKAYGVRQELNAQRVDLAAARQAIPEALSDRTGMENALANVFKHAGDTLEIRNNANSMRAVGSALGVAASGVALAGNVAAVTGVGIGAAFGLAVASATLSFMGLAATVGASIYEAVKGKGDGDLKTAAAGSPEECADMAATNKFAALVVLADQLQSLSTDLPEFKKAERLLEAAGLEPTHVQAIISLARADGDISIQSPAVNELAKALYGAPVGQVANNAAVPQTANASPAADLRV